MTSDEIKIGFAAVAGSEPSLADITVMRCSAIIERRAMDEYMIAQYVHQFVLNRDDDPETVDELEIVIREAVETHRREGNQS